MELILEISKGKASREAWGASAALQNRDFRSPAVGDQHRTASALRGLRAKAQATLAEKRKTLGRGLAWIHSPVSRQDH
jgi:hypothetical protein